MKILAKLTWHKQSVINVSAYYQNYLKTFPQDASNTIIVAIS
jgi:hypothetical protein